MSQFSRILPLIILSIATTLGAQDIPLPEHPRPDFERPDWVNLNGQWAFAFDPTDVGLSENWQNRANSFAEEITVPFPWSSNLSGVADEADIAWYQRNITVDSSWQDRRTFLTIGASDWETTVWLDGQLIGTHQGGYVPFSFELTEFLQYNQVQNLVVRVDDARRDFTLYGKQGYGNARGIWQTIYLEARGQNYIDAVHFTPNIDSQFVEITVYLDRPTDRVLPVEVSIRADRQPIGFMCSIPKGVRQYTFQIDIERPRLWSLKDPYLHETTVKVADDKVYSYFGMRKISVVNLPNTKIPYIALNNVPIYLQMALDQSYHPDGFYTFPSDQFIKEEILRSKSIGLNGIRTHIKVEVPRKLYWADKLGLLVMEDLPNSWGEPDQPMRDESTYTLREMIKRDYNHPSIFSWVIFNETWGLFTKTDEKNEQGKPIRKYLPSTQEWVVSMYELAKSLDASRLVEDNSICCGRGHTETDIYSWHVYLPGWQWDEYLNNLTANNFEGSTFDFEEGYTQGNQPNINSECGNVWGYQGSTGDVDYSWDYHRMLNSFRRFPKVGGWLYTEHHDVINEWNGYWRFDRSEKETGLGDFVKGMSLKDLHSTVYLSTGNEICQTVEGGAKVEVPLHLSCMTNWRYGDSIFLDYTLQHTNFIGQSEQLLSERRTIAYQPFLQKQLSPLPIQLPSTAGVATLGFTLSTMTGKVLHRNFTIFEILSAEKIPNTQVFSVKAADFSEANWSQKQWSVLDGLKVNGAGKGFFEYRIPLPADLAIKEGQTAQFVIEASAKELFVKDQENYNSDQDFMKGSRVAPSSNPNAYPMTDETTFPSEIEVSIDGKVIYTTTLADDPADHRGVLSWHHQLKDRKLREAGSYGYLLEIPVEQRLLEKAVAQGALTIRLATKGEGGMAVYGKAFGRYAVDPCLVIKG
ncbi:MAG: sugar-binding domain-containing protein [Bacteroidota bacterium]